MIRVVLGIVAVAVAAVLVAAAFRPDTFSVQRSISIEAPPDAVYSLLADLRRWAAWSPWERKDAGMKRTFGATTEGKGATYAWAGNSEVGQGRMEIVEALEPWRLGIRLDFIEPFEAHNMVGFTLEPRGRTTHVTWTMRGPVPYPARLLHMFVDMDGMVGKEFEAGLANLKLAAEKRAAGANPQETR